jgi:hypothetical protein
MLLTVVRIEEREIISNESRIGSQKQLDVVWYQLSFWKSVHCNIVNVYE